MDWRLGESVVNGQHVLFGRALKPWCYEFAEVLTALKSPIVSQGAEQQIDPSDLLFAAAVCATEPTKVGVACTMIKPRLRDRWHLFRMIASRRYFRAQLQAFADYVADHSAFPRQMDRADDSKTSVNNFTGPVMFARLCSVLIRYKGAISEERARSMPIGLLVWYDEMGANLNGTGRPFFDEETEAAIDAALERAEQAGKELLKNGQS